MRTPRALHRHPATAANQASTIRVRLDAIAGTDLCLCDGLHVAVDTFAASTTAIEYKLGTMACFANALNQWTRCPGTL
jgi:hypothetical protein